MSLPKVIRQPLPYFPDSAKLFALLAGVPWSVFLDSGSPYSQQGRYDILAADPICTLVTRGEETEICRDGLVKRSNEDPFLLVNQQLGEQLPALDDLPFNGGAIGYFSYDLARRLEKLPVLAKNTENIPEMAVGIYLWAVIVDHKLKKSWLVGQDHPSINWQQLIDQFSVVRTEQEQTAFQVLGEVTANMSQTEYAKAFSRIKGYLREGDCYQVNLTQRFIADCQGDPWLAYQKLREVNAAPFSCYLNIPGVQVLSSSPERFLKVKQGLVETKPIKGTRPRKQDFLEDQQQIEQLQNSDKDRAENVMIVDLLRNDLSKTCQPGSVKVPELFAVESYATVHHLVSTVTGILDVGQHALDLLRSCFPGGSITGAPKIRAMEIIEELEPDRRGIYCGSIGYVGFDGNMDTNIAIRTMVHANGKVHFSAGGGIVYDSVMQDEYQETFDKVSALLKLLKQMAV
jgi:para-aminobenzoate synthetase component 1